MATLPLSSLLSTPSIKIFDETNKIVRWSRLKIKQVDIAVDSDNAVVPLSNVQVSENATYTQLLESDLMTAKIIRPNRLRISAWSADLSTTESILQAFSDVSLTFQITSKSIISDSMIMLGIELEQAPENMTAVLLTMEFEQANPPSRQGEFDPAQPSDQSARGLRIQAPVSLSQNISDIYNRIFQ